MTRYPICGIMHLVFAGVAHLVERDLAKVEVASSSLVARSKKERHPHGCLSFLEQHFCYAKVVACGRVTEREWGNPSKVPPSHSPFLAMCGSADNKACGQSQKGNHPNGVVFLFGKSLSKMNRTRIAKIRLQAGNPWDDHVRSSKRPRLLPGSLLL